jgi:hypothetical protein
MRGFYMHETPDTMHEMIVMAPIGATRVVHASLNTAVQTFLGAQPTHSPSDRMTSFLTLSWVTKSHGTGVYSVSFGMTGSTQ